MANENRIDPTPRIDESLEAIATMLAHMRTVLSEIEDLAEFHQAIKDLKQIIDLEKIYAGIDLLDSPF